MTPSVPLIALAVLLGAACGVLAPGCNAPHTQTPDAPRADAATAGDPSQIQEAWPEPAHWDHEPVLVASAARGDAALVATPGTPARFDGIAPSWRFSFKEALLSWNIKPSPGARAVLEVRANPFTGFGPPPDDAPGPTEWLTVSWWPDHPTEDDIDAIKADPLGVRVDVDYLVSDIDLASLDVRVRSFGGQTTISRIDATLSTPSEDPADWYAGPAEEGSYEPGPFWVDVPFRAQADAGDDLAGRLCSPTSLAMTLARTDGRITAAVTAPIAYDAEHGIYGNWVRNVQAAYTLGQPAVLTRINSWTEAERWVRGEVTGTPTPIVISFRAQRGTLTGADYNTASGHLVVLRGFDANGDPMVMDPAFSNADDAAKTYPRGALGKAWLGTAKGTAYIIQPD